MCRTHILALRLPVRRTLALLAAFTCVIGFALLPKSVLAEWHTITGPLPVHTGEIRFTISPNSETVAYVADIDEVDVYELYSSPISGTTPIKLNPPLVAGGSVNRFRYAFTPDSQHIIYAAEQDVVNRQDLYSVPVAGGDAVKLNPPLVAGGNITLFVIDGSNNRIIYLADQEINERFELWSIPITGGASTKLNGALVPGGNVGIFKLDPLSDRVVFSADAETDGKYELYSALVAGGGLVKLNPPIVTTGGGDSGIFSEFEINPIVPVVVFFARQMDEQGGRLYMTPTAGGAEQLLSFNLLDTQRLIGFRISPTGDRVVFNVGTKVGSTFPFMGNLHSNFIGGGGLANVTETADPLFGVNNYQFLPDGSRIVYFYTPDADTPLRLESATPLGVRTTLHAPGDSDPTVFNFVNSPNSEWVMFQTEYGGPGQHMRMIPPTGGLPTNHGTGDFLAHSPDSSRIFYRRYVDENHSELMSAQSFGGDERNLSGMEGNGFVADAVASSDSKWIVFSVYMDDKIELRVSDGNEAQDPPVAPVEYRMLLPTVHNK
jgi:hypothetical protein